MRYKLKNLDSQRLTFTAIVNRFDTKPGWHADWVPIVELHNVRFADGKKFAAREMFAVGKTWIGVKVGDVVVFDARIAEYQEEYTRDDGRIGFKEYRHLERPTKVRALTRQREEGAA